MMLFTKYLTKEKHIYKFWYWINLKSSIKLDIKSQDVTLVQCPSKLSVQCSKSEIFNDEIYLKYSKNNDFLGNF